MTTSTDLGSDHCDPPERSDRHRRMLHGSRAFVWIIAVTMAAMLGSERIYWFWTGVDADSISVLTGFYAVAAAAALFVMAVVPVVSVGQLFLAGAIYALVVEGVITTVVYEDGPLPLLFFMFVGWHGVIAFVGLFYAVRRWLLEGRVRWLAVAATGTGIVWGVWAVATLAGDTETPQAMLADGDAVHVLAPAAFAWYASWVGALLIAAHLVLGWCWPAVGWRPSRLARITLAVLTAGLALLLVVPAVPWAPLKFAAFAGLLWWLLRRGRPAPGGAPAGSLLDRLGGRVRFRHALVLVLLPASAAAVYAAVWPWRDADWMPGLYHAMVAGQVVIGVGALAWAVHQSVATASSARSVAAA